jgi:hypothetical protein
MNQVKLTQEEKKVECLFSNPNIFQHFYLQKRNPSDLEIIRKCFNPSAFCAKLPKDCITYLSTNKEYLINEKNLFVKIAKSIDWSSFETSLWITEKFEIFGPLLGIEEILELILLHRDTTSKGICSNSQFFRKLSIDLLILFSNELIEFYLIQIVQILKMNNTEDLWNHLLEISKRYPLFSSKLYWCIWNENKFEKFKLEFTKSVNLGFYL